MKKRVILLVLLICLTNITNLNASTGLLKSTSIIECDGKLYGKHGSDNHYHLAEETNDGKYKAVGDSLGSDWTCKGTLKNPLEEKELEKVDATFVKCVDGDTAVFNVLGVETKFRFLGIDTPETVHPTKDEEAYGKNASVYTCNKIKMANKIEIEYEESKTDKYGRSLGWIWVDGSLLQKELIEIGYAEVAYIYGTYKYTEELCEVQGKSIEQSKGIWKDGTRKEGYCSTLRSTPIQKQIAINEINTKEEEKKEKNFTIETIGGISLALLILFIKIVKK